MTTSVQSLAGLVAMAESIRIRGADTNWLDPSAVRVEHCPNAPYAAVKGPWAVLYKGKTMEAFPDQESARDHVADQGKRILKLSRELDSYHEIAERAFGPGRSLSDTRWGVALRDFERRTVAQFKNEKDALIFVTAVQESAKAWTAEIGVSPSLDTYAPTDPVLFALSRIGIGAMHGTPAEMVDAAAEAVWSGEIPMPKGEIETWPEMLAWIRTWEEEHPIEEVSRPMAGFGL